MTSRLLAYRPEMEMPSPGGGRASALPQQDGLVLAARLLEVAGPRQFDAFLSQMLAGNAWERPLRQLLGSVMAPLLPLHGSGQQRAARIFGLELEGLTPEDREFALARHVVDLIAAVAAALAQRSGSRQAPGEQVETALLQVARKLAPGLLGQLAPGRQKALQQGRWRREGGHLVVLDC
ncbi:hypothetical protein [Janthinobacterium sp.]|uniref:hypothetical protein n=1 Tax=Janthinobacterium sp. TaxID=1871054 RepID=UPI002625474F|nr:hypothetical protein [Janthinobacterium sp.]